MKFSKQIYLIVLTLLLVVLQPVVSYGNGFDISTASVTNLQEEIILLKTKNAKAIVFKDILVNSAEQTLFYGAIKKPFSQFVIYTHVKIDSVKKEDYLIDFRSILSSQIFPFHIFL